MEPEGPGRGGTILRRLRSAQYAVIGVSTAATLLVLTFAYLVREAQLGLRSRLDAVEGEALTLHGQVQGLLQEQFHPATAERALLVRFGRSASAGPLQYRVFDVTAARDRWMPQDNPGQDEPRPVAATADFQIPLPALEAFACRQGAMQVCVIGRTNNAVRQHDDAPIRFRLGCDRGLGDRREYPIVAHFFEVNKRRGLDSDEKLAQSGRMLSYRGTPRFWVEVDGMRLMNSFAPEGRCDLLISLEATLVAGAKDDAGVDGR